MNTMTVPENVSWICPPQRVFGSQIETSYFKLVFNLNKVKPLTVNICALSRFCFYVNGTAILDGPCKGEKWHAYADTVDITRFLIAGKNTLAVKVTAYPPREAMNSGKTNMGPISVYGGDAGPVLILWSDQMKELSTGEADWLVMNDTAITWTQCLRAFWAGCMEDVDGEKLPADWQSADLQPADRQPGALPGAPKHGGSEAESGFEKAIVKITTRMDHGERNLPRLYTRPIKQLLRTPAEGLRQVKNFGNFLFDEKTKTAHLGANGSYKALLDFGKLTTCFMELPVTGGKGAKITIGYSEGFGKPTERHSGQGTDVWIEKTDRCDYTGDFLGIFDVYHPGGRSETYKPFWFRTFRFILIEVQTNAEPCEISLPLLTETRYPTESKVSFESEHSPWLTDVWSLSVRTLKLCMHETYEDCPFYEQLQYAMDTRLQMLFTYAVSNDSSMAVRTINDFHMSMLPEGILQSRYPSIFPQVIPIFSLHWIFMLKDYYMETGDLNYIRQFRFTMGSILNWFNGKLRGHGLLEKIGYWEFFDWADEWYRNRGVPSANIEGPSGLENMVYSFALDEAAFLLDAMGQNDEGGRLREQASSIRARLESLCWSNEKQLYRDGPGFEAQYSQHAQVWAVICGLAQKDRAKAIMLRAMSDKSLVRCSFAMSYYLFRALEITGLYELTEGLWPAWRSLLDQNLTTVPEKPGKSTRSDCHAWGAIILNELPRKMLGVEPVLPGYETIRIEPKALFIKDIKGKVPTPRGDVEIGWKAEGGGFAISGNTPVPAELILPDSRVYKLQAGKFAYSTQN